MYSFEIDEFEKAEDPLSRTRGPSPLHEGILTWWVQGNGGSYLQDTSSLSALRTSGRLSIILRCQAELENSRELHELLCTAEEEAQENLHTPQGGVR